MLDMHKYPYCLMRPNRVVVIEAMLCFVVVIYMSISALKYRIKCVNAIIANLFSSLNLECKQICTWKNHFMGAVSVCVLPDTRFTSVICKRKLRL